MWTGNEHLPATLAPGPDQTVLQGADILEFIYQKIREGTAPLLVLGHLKGPDQKIIEIQDSQSGQPPVITLDRLVQIHKAVRRR